MNSYRLEGIYNLILKCTKQAIDEENSYTGDQVLRYKKIIFIDKENIDEDNSYRLEETLSYAIQKQD